MHGHDLLLFGSLSRSALSTALKGFLIFVDLRKAYDSVPRPALWAVLQKLGVPDVMVRLVESFHADMVADIIVDGSSVDGIPVCNGLRQGCTMAPVLFNLFAAAVIEQWHDRLQVLGVAVLPFKYRADGQLFKRSVRGTESSLPSATVNLLMTRSCWLRRMPMPAQSCKRLWMSHQRSA